VGLFGLLGNRRNAVGGKLQLIVDREDIGRTNVAVDESFAVKKSEGLQRGSQNIPRFGGSERALRQELRKIFFGELHQDVQQFKTAEMAAAGLVRAQQMRMRKFGGVLPAKYLQLGLRFIHLNKLDG